MCSYKNLAWIFSVGVVGVGLSAAKAAGPVGVDGVIGADWAGVTPVSVSYNATAPEANYGSPGTQSDTVPYNIYVRDDGSYYYIAVQASTAAPYDFANFYLGNNTDTSYLGFEVNNDRAFVPGVSTGGNDGLNDGYFDYTTSSSGIVRADDFGTGTDTTIEVAIPNSFFLDNPLGIPTLPNADTDMELRLSQAFGYSVAGGTGNYGSLDLGTASVAVPEPASLAVLGLGALAMLGRRRRQV